MNSTTSGPLGRPVGRRPDRAGITTRGRTSPSSGSGRASCWRVGSSGGPRRRSGEGRQPLAWRRRPPRPVPRRRRRCRRDRRCPGLERDGPVRDGPVRNDLARGGPVPGGPRARPTRVTAPRRRQARESRAACVPGGPAGLTRCPRSGPPDAVGSRCAGDTPEPCGRSLHAGRPAPKSGAGRVAAWAAAVRAAESRPGRGSPSPPALVRAGHEGRRRNPVPSGQRMSSK